MILIITIIILINISFEENAHILLYTFTVIQFMKNMSCIINCVHAFQSNKMIGRNKKVVDTFVISLACDNNICSALKGWR